MAEEKEKTAEEKLLEDAKNSGAGKEGGEGSGDGDSGMTPEEKIIADLKEKAKTNEERAKKAEEERDSERLEKDAAKKAAATATGERDRTQKEMIASQLAATKSKFESAQKEWDDAHDSGDKTKLRIATEQLNDAQMALRSAEYNSAQYKTWEEGNARRETVDPNLREFRTGTGDTLKLPVSAIEWAKGHPLLSTDREYTEAVYDADTRAKRRGIEPYSKEYYAFLDNHVDKMGLRKKDDEPNPRDNQKDDVDPEPKKDKKNASSSAAPVGGSTGSGSGTNTKKTFRMSAEHREAARISFPDLPAKDAEEKYAKYQLDIQERRNRGEKI